MSRSKTWSLSAKVTQERRVTKGPTFRGKSVELKRQVHPDICRAQNNKALSPALRGEQQRKGKSKWEKKDQGRLPRAVRAQNGPDKTSEMCIVCRGTMAHTAGCLPNTHSLLPGRAWIYSNMTQLHE